MKTNAFNVSVMDVENFIERNICQPVTTTLIKQPSSHAYHPDGIFSEDIFGQINTPERIARFGYVDLNTTIITPVLFRMVKALAPWHVDVMAGRQMATFDKATGLLEKSSTDEGDTGFSFYMKVFPDIKFKESKSISRSEKIQVLDRTRKRGMYQRYLIEPAGLRDIEEDETGRQKIEDINKLYIQLVSYTKALGDGSSKSRIYDPIRFNVQMKAVEIYSYLDNMMDGKRGFLRGQYGHRNVALGTRNVITATNYSANSPDDPQFLKPTETLVGLFQVMKGMQPLVIHHLKTVFTYPTFGEEIDQTTIPLTDPKTYELVYVDVSEDERESFTNSDELAGMISRFGADDFRSMPVKVYSRDGKPFYLRALYDDGRRIMMFSSIVDLKRVIPDFKKEYIRPMTYIDMMYICTYLSALGRHCFITRYPVLGDGSCYPSEIHVATTTPSRKVKLLDNDGNTQIEFSDYPILGKQYIDGVSLASPRLNGLGADHDGDTVSVNFVLLDEANEECKTYLQSPRSMVDTNANLIASSSTDLIDYALFGLTHVQEDL